MNESNRPPTLPGTPQPSDPMIPLGEGPGEKESIVRASQAVEVLLRQPRRLVYQLQRSGTGKLALTMAVLGLLCAIVYGLVVGSFSGGTQLWAAPLKLGGGLLLAGMICLPSLYIFACLSGSTARFVEVAGMVCGLILLMTLLLTGFAPVAWVFSQSTNSIVGMGVLHLLFGFVALIFGMRFLSQGFRWLGTPSNAGIKVWMVLFTLVVVQMTTALRPILGTADTILPTEKKFFLVHWADQIDAPAERTAARSR